MVTLYTFGNSTLDCGTHNKFGVYPEQLLVENDDRLFPEFQSQDLTSCGTASLEHRARDGATIEQLPSQAQGLQVEFDANAHNLALSHTLVTQLGSNVKKTTRRRYGDRTECAI